MSHLRTVNIGGTASDAFYRYKRECIELKHEQKHGGQTKLVNLDRICQQLHTPRKHLIKYLQKKLACSSIGTDNIIRQVLQVSQIETVIDKYVKRYILCPECRLPEWDMAVCKACGFQATKGSTTQTCNNNTKSFIKQPDEEPDGDDDAQQVPGISQLMHEIYAMREQWQLLKRDVGILDQLNDECWVCQGAEQLTQLRVRWRQLLEREA